MWSPSDSLTHLLSCLLAYTYMVHTHLLPTVRGLSRSSWNTLPEADSRILRHSMASPPFPDSLSPTHNGILVFEPASREVLGHNRSRSQWFQSPTGAMLWSDAWGEPVVNIWLKVRDFRRIIDRFRGIYGRIYLKLMKAKPEEDVNM